MSGFEVAGVVLGGIPLVISTLEHYKNGISVIQRYRRYERELQRLIRNLETEKVKLQNVCEKLLDGIVPPSRIDDMVENPGGDLWVQEEIQKAIRIRLWKSWNVFETTLKDIQKATEEMYEKLGGGTETSWSDMTLAAKELKRITFALGRSAYSEQLATIKDGISSLESLATMSIELEPKRRVRSQIKALGILRTIAWSIYRAVQSSLKCTHEHQVSVGLSGCTDTFCVDEDEDVGRGHHVDLFLTHSQLQDKKSHLVEPTRQNWEGRLLKVVPNAQCPPRVPTSLSSSSLPTAQKLGKEKRSVRFSMSRFSSSGTITETTTSSINSGVACMSLETTTRTSQSYQPCLDLCSETKANIGPACLGSITDDSAGQTRTYQVYNSTLLPLEAQGSIVPLSDVLRNEDTRHLFTYRQRLQLAVSITTSVVHLYKTPFMNDLPTARNIILFQRQGVVDYNRAFLKGDRSCLAECSSGIAIPTPKLLPLGVLLIELIKGQSLESLRTPNEILGGNLSAFSNFITSQRLADEICQASSNYGSAVRRCLDVGFKAQACAVEDENFQHNFYSGIVALLEEDLNSL
ncbi:uncharacterized protein B0J16DRAFT_345606 [Fusarium flagelliforme]|uniref:uncharacterized protein n=1 Tax=Fusarium flagelliforme TaxID=2675880 RepID=UPI001E8E1E03|nr:uncharacterized protein B0J16DRAFT_345606 [Fusarium flagelliforme]KAH7183267.1 hypothetical protein B0J16DRAFT_345606 [Fusarium flagelliforme]